MKKLEEVQKKWRNILWYVGCIIIVLSTVVWYKVISYDTQDLVVDASTTDSKVTATLDSNSDTNDSWKSAMPLSNRENDYLVMTGTTCNASVNNGNQHNIRDWKLRINIKQECYLNGFGCGSFEVHQFRNDKEIVEVVSSRDMDASSLNIDYNPYADTLMIHLLPGDYLVYLPSVTESEELIKPENSVGIGFIFYYKGTMDLTDYELTYHNDLKMKDDILFKIVEVLLLIWAIILLFSLYLKTVMKRMKAEMNSQIRNMSIMANLYLEVHMIQVDEDSSVLIKGDKENLFFDIEGKSVQEGINHFVCDKCSESYQAGMLRFLDLKSVKERMNGASSIAFEWIDEEMGWLSARLFFVGDEKGQIVLALQDINEEKKKITAVEDRIRMAEFTQVVNGSFMGNVSAALNEIATQINQTGKALLENQQTEPGLMMAKGIVASSRHLMLLQNTLFDMYAIESKRFTLNEEPYSVKELVEELKVLVEPFVARDKYDFMIELDQDIPERLMGDSGRLEQMLVVLLLSSLMVTQSGFVKLSIYGKNHGSNEEMVFSIRDSAMGFSEGQVKEILSFIKGSRIESFDNAALVYLKIINGMLEFMHSELKVVSVQGEGSEFYFSLSQDIVK